jgi:hypothetical protein
VHWVEAKMTPSSATSGVAATLDDLLQSQAQRTPEASERLATLTAAATPAAGQYGASVLGYLTARRPAAAARGTLRRSRTGRPVCNFSSRAVLSVAGAIGLVQALFDRLR